MARSTIAPYAKHVPVAIQQAAIGTSNPVANALIGRGLPLPTLITKGRSQQRERFVASGTLSASEARQLNSIQDASARAASVLQHMPFADANLIQNLTFPFNTTMFVPHDLGRVWVGYTVFSIVGNAPQIFATRQTGNLDAATIKITNNSGALTGDLWIW